MKAFMKNEPTWMRSNEFIPFSREIWCGMVRCSICERRCRGMRSGHRDPVGFHPFESSPAPHSRLF